MRRSPAGSAPVRLQSGNALDFARKPGSRRRRVPVQNRCLAGLPRDSEDPALCLPCRRSRVRIPSAALKKACICRPFLRAQSHCSSASGRTDSGLAAGRSSAVPKENALFAGRFWFVRTEVLLRTCRRSGVRPAAAVTPTPAATARSISPRSATRRAMAPRAVSFSAGRRPRQRRGPHHGELVSR